MGIFSRLMGFLVPKLCLGIQLMALLRIDCTAEAVRCAPRQGAWERGNSLLRGDCGLSAWSGLINADYNFEISSGACRADIPKPELGNEEISDYTYLNQQIKLYYWWRVWKHINRVFNKAVLLSHSASGATSRVHQGGFIIGLKKMDTRQIVDRL